MKVNSKCPICGAPTNVYMGNARKDKLCFKHGKMANKQEIKLNDDGKYVSVSTGEILNSEIDIFPDVTSHVCVICGKESNAKEICTECYKEIMAEYDELDKNQKKWELKDYYYNLKSNISRLKSYQYVINNTYRLFAIAWSVKWNCKDEQLSDIVVEDVKKIIKAKEPLKEKKIDNKEEQTDKAIIAASNVEKNRAVDGHICKSAGEVLIDNILYRSHVCHAYQKTVKEINSDTERTVVSDWFIPLSGTKGIYIEFWGMDKKDYQDNKEEKQALYKKHNLKLIEINKNDVNDEEILENTIYRELIKFGWKPQED